MLSTLLRNYLTDTFSSGVLSRFDYQLVIYGLSFVCAFIIVWLYGERLIDKLKDVQGKGQPIRDNGPQSHLLSKKGTPTMGGLLIFLGLNIALLLFGDLHSKSFWILLLANLGFTFIGFVDDYLKVAKQNTAGMSGTMKLLILAIITICICFVMYYFYSNVYSYEINLFNFGSLYVGLPVILIFMYLVISGSSNAVNLTDGLDGLAASTTLISFLAFFAISLVIQDTNGVIVSNQIANDVSVFAMAYAGAILGFLWYNSYPAQIFMGDTGSMAIGGSLATIAILLKQELFWVILGGLYVWEAASVILQVSSFKLRGKRVFLMAPIHHHYEKKGQAETKVVWRFFTVNIILSTLAIALFIIST